MSGYGKMQASPFWKRMMRITGILCFVTLMIPPVLYFKYLIVDRPVETALAGTAPANAAALPVNFRYTELFRNRAIKSREPSDRIQAINYLHSLIRLPGAQILHNNECKMSEFTLAQEAQSDPAPAVKSVAGQALADLGTHGAVIQR